MLTPEAAAGPPAGAGRRWSVGRVTWGASVFHRLGDGPRWSSRSVLCVSRACHRSTLAMVIFAGRLGVLKSLPDDVLKVRVHVGMRTQPAAKEKPRARAALLYAPRVTISVNHTPKSIFKSVHAILGAIDRTSIGRRT